MASRCMLLMLCVAVACVYGRSSGPFKRSIYGHREKRATCATGACPAAICVSDQCEFNDGEYCADDAACTGAGEGCVNGKCENVMMGDHCRDGGDCAAGSVCVGGTCEVVIGDVCAVSSDCTGYGKGMCCGNTCQACCGDLDCTAPGTKCYKGECAVISPGDCQTDDHCLQFDGVCVSNACKPKGEFCSSDNDCNGLRCYQRSCKELDGSDCLTAQDCKPACIGAMCRFRDGTFCTQPEDCSSLQCGANGMCIPEAVVPVGCLDDTTCPENNKCLKNQCRPINGEYCASVADCNEGHTCIDTQCEPLNEVGNCVDDSLCTNPEEPYCIGGECVECTELLPCMGGGICFDNSCEECLVDGDCMPGATCVFKECEPGV